MPSIFLFYCISSIVQWHQDSDIRTSNTYDSFIHFQELTKCLTALHLLEEIILRSATLFMYSPDHCRLIFPLSTLQTQFISAVATGTIFPASKLLQTQLPNIIVIINWFQFIKHQHTCTSFHYPQKPLSCTLYSTTPGGQTYASVWNLTRNLEIPFDITPQCYSRAPVQTQTLLNHFQACIM